MNASTVTQPSLIRPAAQAAAPPLASPSAVAASTADLDRRLAEAAQNRQQQLAALAHDEHDHVIRAQRESLTQVLAEIGRAQERLTQGSFGTCMTCADQISVERLEVRPWSATCVGCAAR